VPYFGSMKGANETLWQKEANDMDQASLLIAMYRHCGIPARYVVGTVEVPIEKAMNWAGGFTNKNAALTAFYYGGIPLKPIFEGGKFTKIRMEHVWVEAWLSVDRYRGAKDPGAEAYNPSDPYAEARTWTYMDPSYKQYAYKKGHEISNILSNNAIDLDTQLNSLVPDSNGGYLINNLDSFSSILKENINQIENSVYNDPNIESLSDIFGNKELLTSNIKNLVGNIDIPIFQEIERFSEIPVGYAYRFEFKIIETENMSSYDEPEEKDVLSNCTINLVDLSSKRITLSYGPVTQDDEDIISNLLQTDPLPTSIASYLVKVKPQLAIDGVVSCDGTGAFSLGTVQKSVTLIHYPTYGTLHDFSFYKELNAGSYYALGLKMGMPTKQFLSIKKGLHIEAKQNIENGINLKKDLVIGEILHTIITSYFVHTMIQADFMSQTQNIYYYSLPSVSFAHTFQAKDNIFGITKKISSSDMIIDVADRIVALSLDGSDKKTKAFTSLESTYGSFYEGNIWSEYFGGSVNPVSTIYLLKEAVSSGQIIYTETSEKNSF